MGEAPTDSSELGTIDKHAATDGADEGDFEAWRAFTAEAYESFHRKLLANRSRFPWLANFAAVERADATNGTFAWWWGAASEIRETINCVNAWGVRLHEWSAWNLVIDSYEDVEDRFEVFNHFVEPVAFFYMLQPSSFTDRLMVVSETLLHQANRWISQDYPDQLDQDKLKTGSTLRRSDRRKQLNRLGKPWSTFGEFRNALTAMDGPGYQKVTRNFRDLSNHSFAPRIMSGHVVRTIRSIVPRTEMVAQSDDTYLAHANPTHKCVQYAMRDIEPLPLADTHSANFSEYQKAMNVMDAFEALIDELCDRIDSLPKHGAEAKLASAKCRPLARPRHSNNQYRQRY